MRKIIILCFLLIAANCYGQIYYTVNWATAPENPIPVKFTPNHFGLNGKVKLMVTRSELAGELTAFDEKGICKGIEVRTKSDTTETRYFLGLPTKIAIRTKKLNKSYGNRLEAFIFKYGDPVEMVPTDDEEKPQETLKMAFNYNNKGLYEGLKATGEYNPALQYQYFYNDAKQIIKIRQYQEFKFMNTMSKKELSTTLYEYKQEENVLKITITETEAMGEINRKIIRHFNQFGLLVYENYFSYGTTNINSITYIMDEQNNWISSTTTDLTEGIENKGKSKVTTRMIQYY